MTNIPNMDKITAQQKLKLKMVSLDTWSTREQLCLASSVLRSGDQNWVSVSRSLKSFAEPNRPSDWLSPKNCALQYNSLLEKTGAQKRKRGERHPSTGPNDSQAGETPGEIILRQLTQERIEELQKVMETLKKDYQMVMKELESVQQGKSDGQLVEICKRIDEENERKVREQKDHEKWLEEREKKQQEMKQVQQLLLRSPAKTSATGDQTDTEPAAASPSVTEQLNVDVEASESRGQHAAIPVESKYTPTTAPNQAPTPSSPLLTSLLQSPTASGSNGAPKTPSSASKQLLTSTSPSSMSPGLKNLVSAAISKEPTSKPVAVSPNSGAAAPTLTRLLEMPLNSPGKPLPEIQAEESGMEAVEVETALEEIVEIKTEIVTEETIEDSNVPCSVQEEMEVESQEEVVTSELIEQDTVPEPSDKVEVEISTESTSGAVQEEGVEELSQEKAKDQLAVKDEPEDLIAEVVNEVELNLIESLEKPIEEAAVETSPITPKKEQVEEEQAEEEEKKTEEELPALFEEKSESKEGKMPESDETPKESEATTPKLTRRPLRGNKAKKTSVQDAESPAEEKIKPAEPGPVTRRTRKSTQAEEHESEAAEEPAETAPPSTVGKKKTSLPPLYVSTSSPAPSSGIESFPNSPNSSVSTVTEDDRDYRTWKKSILLVWREISSHKNASLFAKPITEDAVPGYHSLVMRPMDLSTIKKNIESGAIRSTTEFQRDVSLMFFNSIMYNPNYHEVNRLAKEMYAESSNIIQEFSNAQLLAAHNAEASRPQRRETRDHARRTESLSSHEDTPSKLEETKVTRASKRASTAPLVEEASSAVKSKRRSRAQPNE